MSDDLFSRALENSGSITAEELKLNPVEGQDTLPSVDVKTTAVVDATKSEVTGLEKTVEEQQHDKQQGDSESEYDSSSSSESDDDDDDDGNSSSDADADEDDQIDEVAEEEDEEPNSNEPIRSKNEIADDKIIEVPEDYKIDEKTNITEIGIIKSVFESNVIVQGITSGEKRVLKDGSIFCLENREVIGTLSEVFGQLQHPFYRVGISPVNESKNEIISKVKELIGTKIFIVVPDAHWIDTFELKRIKGTDASNGYDEELPEDEQEFSDDEKEAQFKKIKKSQKKKKNTNNKKDNNTTNNNNNNRVNKKRPQNNTTNYAKMKLPVGMTQQQSHYRSRNNRTTEDSNTPNPPSTTNQLQNKFQPQQNQGQYNNYNTANNYPQSNMPNNNMYTPPPQQQFNGNYGVPGQVPFNYNAQSNAYNTGYNMPYNYPNQNYQQYPSQQNFQQHPAYNQTSNMYYQQLNPAQYQQPLPPPPQPQQQQQSNTPQQTLDQVHQLHQILLQQRNNNNNNNNNNQPPSSSQQNSGNQDNSNGNIPY